MAPKSEPGPVERAPASDAGAAGGFGTETVFFDTARAVPRFDPPDGDAPPVSASDTGRASASPPAASPPSASRRMEAVPLPLYRSLRRFARRRKTMRRIARAMYRRLRHKRFHLSLMAVVVGACAGATALLLRASAHFVAHGIARLDESLAGRSPVAGWMMRLAPSVGLVLTVVLVRYLLRDPSPASVFSVLKAIRKRGYLRFRHIVSSICGCALTVGFGGSVGIEAPVIATGSTVGSNLAEKFRMSRGSRALLIACGAAGGISAIFNAPVAGFLFAMEVLLGGVVVEMIVPLLLASVSGNVIGRLMGLEASILSVRLDADFTLRDLAASAALGVVCGLGSVAFLAIFARVKGWMARLVRLAAVRTPAARGLGPDAADDTKTAVFARAVLAGLLLAGMVHFAPSLYGDGLAAMRDIGHGNTDVLMLKSVLAPWADVAWMVVVYALAVPLLKALATAITLGGGGVGGIFIPCLFMGCFGGWAFARAANLAFGADFLASPPHFVMAGMAGMVAGVVHAPLTGIFLCVENSGGYSWFVPFIVTATFSYLVHSTFQPYSIYSGGPEAEEKAPAGAVRKDRPSLRY